MTLLDAWAWSEIATISEKKGGGGLFGGLRSASSHARCTVKLEMVGGRRKNVRLKDASDLRRFFHTVARFTPTEKVGGRRRTLWRQRRALRLLHTHAPSQGLPNGTGTLPPSSAAAVARLSPDRAALEVPSSSGGRGSRNGSTHQRWPIVEEEEEEEVEEGENGEVNPGTSSSFIVRLPATASRAPSYATLLRKQKQKQKNQEQEEEEENLESVSSISERGKRLSLSTRSVVSTETQTEVYPPPPPPPPPPSLFQTPSYRRPLLKKGVIISAQKLAVAPCLLQASLLDELKSNFRSGIFIPPVRPKLPPAIIAAATLARNATLKRVASTASLPLSPLSRSISEASKSASSSSSFSSTKSVKGDDDDDDDDEAEEEAEDGADDYESRNTGGGNHPLTLFEELQNFIRFGRLRHVEPRVKQVATTTTTFNEDSFRNFRYPLFQRMVSAPALLPSPYFPARAPARPALQVRNRVQEEKEEGHSDNSTPLENHHHQQEEKEEEEEKDINENPPPPPKQKTFILRPQKTPPPPPPPQIIQYHPFSPLENGEVKNVDPDGNNNNGNNGNNNGNAQFRACQLTPVPCAEHGTDLVVQQEHHQQEHQHQDQDQDHQDLITPEKTPFGLLTGQPCRRRALSFASDDHQADDNGEEKEDYMSSKSEISSSKEQLLPALSLGHQES